MKIVMTGGGTAGHVTPNIALIDSLKDSGVEINYIGTADGIERNLIETENVPYHTIDAGKLRRYFSIENVTDIFKIIKGTFEANKHLKKIKPDIVFSKGGFVSCPVVWSAWMNKIPVIIHESDITPGLANKLSMPFAKNICYAFPDTIKYIPNKKAVFTGIPVRDNISGGSRARGMSMCGFAPDRPVILVIGGSLGAKSINNIIRTNLDILLEKYQICHITGNADFDSNLTNKSGYKQFSYVNDELPHLFAMADIVLSRAGATTLFELLKLSKPNVLIPLPKASSRGDQLLNADFFRNSGYSEVVFEEDMNISTLMNALNSALQNKDTYVAKMRSSEISDGSALVINLIKECYAETKNLN